MNARNIQKFLQLLISWSRRELFLKTTCRQRMAGLTNNR